MNFFKTKYFYLTLASTLCASAVLAQASQEANLQNATEDLAKLREAELQKQAENDAKISAARKARFESLRAAEKARVEALMGKLAAQAAASDKKYQQAYVESLRTSTPQLVAENPIEYDTETGVMVAEKNAKLYTSDIEISADKIEFDSKNSSASAQDDVRISQDRVRATSNRVDFDLANNGVKTGYTRLGSAPVFIETEKFSGNKRKYEAKNAKVYFGEPDWVAMNADAGSISYDVENDYLELDDVSFKIGSVPFFYLPSYAQHGLDKPPFKIENEVGYNGDFGLKFKNTVLYTGLKDYSIGALLDGYTKRGVLVGPAAEFDFKRENFSLEGSLRAAYIHDLGDDGILGADEFGKLIEPNRYFIDLSAKMRIGDSFRFTNVLNYWSDQFVLRDFRERIFDLDQIPDNFAEAVYYGDSWQASLFTRYLPNQWTSGVQRLPEARIDVSPRQVLDTGIYQNAYVSLGYYKYSTPYNIVDSLTTSRVDAYYGISRPFKFGSFASFTPIAGARISYYTDTLDGSNLFRAIGQFGFDAQMEAWGLWEIRSNTLNLDGLRHNVRPIIKYRYMPNSESGNGKIKPIDRMNYVTSPAIMDLDLMRNTDEMYSMHTVRFGLENVLETRDANYGTREVARLDLYQDINFDKYPYITDSSRKYSYSDFYVRASVSPTPWISFNTYTRLNSNDANFAEANNYIRISDCDAWTVDFGNIYLQANNISQLYFSIYHKFTERYSIMARWHYDVKINSFTEQVYTLRTRLGNSWFIDYYITCRSGSTRQNNVSFGVNAMYLMY